MRIRSDGNIGIGAGGRDDTTLANQGPITGGTVAYANYISPTIQSDVTTNAYGARTVISTAAAAFTLTNLDHYRATQSTFGVGSTVTNQYGFHAESSLIGATNNYGFFGNLPGGAGRWNFYAAGTAANYFAGPTLVGSATSTGTATQRLQVTGGGYFSGDVGLGTTNPSSRLHVIGDVLITGITTSTDFNSASDIRLKENVKPIDNSLSKLSDLNGVSFIWKKSGSPSMGVIAQDVEKVFPELVSGFESKTVNYNGLIGVLIEAVKELSAEVRELKKNINT
jgi:hypothetical protein